MPSAFRSVLRGAGPGKRSWAQTLKAKEKVDAPTDEELEAEVAKELPAVLEEIDQRERAGLEALHPSYSSIPTFFRAAAAHRSSDPDVGDGEPLRGLWKRLAAQEFLKSRQKRLWWGKTTRALWDMLRESAVADEHGTDRIDYDGYCAVRAKLQASVGPDFDVLDGHYGGGCLDACSFFTLRPEMDDRGWVPVHSIFNALHRKEILYQTRMELELNDQEGHGYLREFEMDRFIEDVVNSTSALSVMPESFRPFYVCGAVRKFFFLLDPHKRGRIYIDDIMTSSVLKELLDTSLSCVDEDNDNAAFNWFSPKSQRQRYHQYMQLDTNRDGMLSKDELYAFGNGSYTPMFIDRAFEVIQTYGCEMDYKRFMDFLLRLENMDHEASVPFFWQVLDLHGTGRVTPVIVQAFFRALHRRLDRMGEVYAGEEAPGWERLVENVTVEVFDMVNPAEPLCIRLEDIKRCKCRGTVFGMLIDCEAFYQYDTREQRGGLGNAHQQHLQALAEQQHLPDDH
eukprot:TRINITY_DN40462_c0_g1_i1.p1 TRINITY_DN40462_c0_g1~~TRINITY_DN40462_c0_g1_i1.p1  ORF type:complete len:510 (+),score=210.28 TRINITY_DN40462_c0_g1_i1:67-1596(+)